MQAVVFTLLNTLVLSSHIGHEPGEVYDACALNYVKRDCTNKLNECGIWANTGECESNQKYMLANCQLSCCPVTCGPPNQAALAATANPPAPGFIQTTPILPEAPPAAITLINPAGCDVCCPGDGKCNGLSRNQFRGSCCPSGSTCCLVDRRLSLDSMGSWSCCSTKNNQKCVQTASTKNQCLAVPKKEYCQNTDPLLPTMPCNSKSLFGSVCSPGYFCDVKGQYKERLPQSANGWCCKKPDLRQCGLAKSCAGCAARGCTWVDNKKCLESCPLFNSARCDDSVNLCTAETKPGSCHRRCGREGWGRELIQRQNDNRTPVAQIRPQPTGITERPVRSTPAVTVANTYTYSSAYPLSFGGAYASSYTVPNQYTVVNTNNNVVWGNRNSNFWPGYRQYNSDGFYSGFFNNRDTPFPSNFAQYLLPPPVFQNTPTSDHIDCPVTNAGCFDKWENGSPDCSGWASQGECERNKLWMARNCAKSCCAVCAAPAAKSEQCSCDIKCREYGDCCYDYDYSCKLDDSVFDSLTPVTGLPGPSPQPFGPYRPPTPAPVTPPPASDFVDTTPIMPAMLPEMINP